MIVRGTEEGQWVARTSRTGELRAGREGGSGGSLREPEGISSGLHGRRVPAMRRWTPREARTGPQRPRIAEKRRVDQPALSERSESKGGRTKASVARRPNGALHLLRPRESECRPEAERSALNTPAGGRTERSEYPGPEAERSALNTPRSTCYALAKASVGPEGRTERSEYPALHLLRPRESECRPGGPNGAL